MATYLLTWNPKRWHWWDDFDEVIEERRPDGTFVMRWSCGNTKSIRKGDRLFLIRLGKEPKGIMASGWATSTPYLQPHWDEAKARMGKLTLYVDAVFNQLLNPDEQILSRRELNRGILSKMYWDSQSSGVIIPEDVAEALEGEWAMLLRQPPRIMPPTEPFAIEGTMTETVRYVRGRSKHLREQALAAANGICCVCDKDYSELLGGKGVRVLQAHHIKQLAASDAPRVTQLSDLAVVCANCHTLIHMNSKRALSVEELRQLLHT